MTLAIASTHRTARKPRPTKLAALLRRHERLIAALDSAIAEHGVIFDMEDEADRYNYGYAVGRDSQHPAVAAASLAILESRREVTRALIHRYPGTLMPSWRDWHHSTKPIIRHREGDKLVLLVPCDDGDCHQGALHPIELDEVIWWTRLVVVDLDA